MTLSFDEYTDLAVAEGSGPYARWMLAAQREINALREELDKLRYEFDSLCETNNFWKGL